MTARGKAAATAKRAAATRKRRADPLVQVREEIEVAKLWAGGASVDEIAGALDVSRDTVRRIRGRLLDKSLPERDVAARELRERELLALDQLQQAHWKEALGGGIGSSKIVLMCIDKRCKLLGLDAPIKVDATTKSELDAQIEQLVEELESAGIVKGASA